MRNGGDSGVVMMAAVAEDGGGRRQRRRQTMTVADNNGLRDWVADYEGDRQERAARDSRDTEWG